MTWLAAVGRDRTRIIGILEIIGAIGLVLPAVTGAFRGSRHWPLSPWLC